MSNHAHFTTATGIPIYFCDPHSPWQRGSNERFNGLLREYPPKGTDLLLTGPAELTEIKDSLNSRPRKTLAYMTPSEKFAALAAATPLIPPFRSHVSTL
jgi:IS30 family transposase